MPSKASRTTAVCQRCGVEFPASPSANRKFCSVECTYPTITYVCKRCGGEFITYVSRPRIFCSNLCRAGITGVYNQFSDSLGYKICERCGKTFQIEPSRPQRFCNRECFKAALAEGFRSAPLLSLDTYFWPNIDKGDGKGCWLWTHRHRNGYGIFEINHKIYDAHRVAWELVAGPIPEGLKALHICDNPPCVRNDEVGTYEINGRIFERRGHLFLGTPLDNAEDRDRKGRLGRDEFGRYA